MDADNPIKPPALVGTTKSERHEFWQGLMKAHAKSQTTIVAFCRERGINPQDFRRWRYRLKKLDTKTTRLKSASMKPFRLQKVTVKEDRDGPVQSGAMPKAIDLQFDAEQMSLSVPLDCSEATWLRLFQVMKSYYYV
jgi:hypothetical protein